MKEEQDDILKEKAERQAQNTHDAEAEAEEAARIKELQEAQEEMLKDLLERQAEEKDPDRLQELFDQQNELVNQMQQLQQQGYNYQTEIPPPREVPQAATYDSILQMQQQQPMPQQQAAN